MNNQTKEIFLQFGMTLSKQESAALRRILARFRQKEPDITENKAAAMILHMVLSRIGENDNVLLGITSIRKD